MGQKHTLHTDMVIYGSKIDIYSINCVCYSKDLITQVKRTEEGQAELLKYYCMDLRESQELQVKLIELDQNWKWVVLNGWLIASIPLWMYKELMQFYTYILQLHLMAKQSI